MVTIPRYNQSLDLTPIKSGRTLATGLSATSGFADLGTSVSKNLNNLAETKINLLAQSRDLDIKNDELLAATNTTEVTLNFLDELTKTGGYKDNEKLYNKTWDYTLSKLKRDIFKNEDGSLDSISYKNYMIQQGNVLYLDGLNQVRELTNKQRINQTKLVIGKSNVDTINSINSNTNIVKKQELYNIAIIEIDNLENILPANEILNLRKNLFDQTNSTYIDAQLRDNEVYINPLGEVQTDYNTIYKNLQNPETYEGNKKLININGNEITYNSLEQKELLESTLLKLNQQEYSNSVNIDKNNNKIMLDTIPKINNIDITLKQINGLPFSNDVGGQELKKELIEMYNLVSQGNLPDQNDTFLINNIFKKVANLKISNQFARVYWPEKGEDNYKLMIARLEQKLGDDFEGFKKTKMSIVDMLSKGMINRETFNQILRSQENPLSIQIQEAFNKALTAYEPVVKGNTKIAGLDGGASTIRVYEYGWFMKNLFNEEVYINNKNPDDLLDPSSKSYIFNSKNLNQFILTLDQQILTIGTKIKLLDNRETLLINDVEYIVNGKVPDKDEWERDNEGDFENSEEYIKFIKNNPKLLEALNKANDSELAGQISGNDTTKDDTTKNDTTEDNTTKDDTTKNDITENDITEEQDSEAYLEFIEENPIDGLTKQEKKVFDRQIKAYQNAVEQFGQDYANKFNPLTELQIQYLESIKEK